MENLLNREQQLEIKEEDFIKSASQTVRDLKTKNAEIIQGGFYCDVFSKILKSRIKFKRYKTEIRSTKN